MRQRRHPPSAKSPESLASVRDAAGASTDGEEVGRWLLSETFAPGGTVDGAARARKRLASLKHDGLWGASRSVSTTRCTARLKRQPSTYVAVLVAAQTSLNPLAPLAAWYAVHHLLGLRAAVNDLYEHHRKELDALVSAPGKLGWRAAAELVEWSIAETFDRAETTGDAYDALVKKRSGCASGVALAGPFGHGSDQDRRRSFDAEKPGPWPPSWGADPLRGPPARAPRRAAAMPRVEQRASGRRRLLRAVVLHRVAR